MVENAEAVTKIHAVVGQRHGVERRRVEARRCQAPQGSFARRPTRRRWHRCSGGGRRAARPARPNGRCRIRHRSRRHRAADCPRGRSRNIRRTSAAISHSNMPLWSKRCHSRPKSRTVARSRLSRVALHRCVLEEFLGPCGLGPPGSVVSCSAARLCSLRSGRATPSA